MTRKDIVTIPDPVLRQRSRRVGHIDPEIKQLVQDMTEATLDWEDHRHNETAVALAAVQIGRLERVVIIRNNFQDPADRTFGVIINPKIAKQEGEPELAPEGCLSVDGIYGQVPRYPQVKVKGLDLDGKEIRLTAEGFLARVLQHEIDHTRGKLFIDRVKNDEFSKINDEGKFESLPKQELERVIDMANKSRS